MPYEWIDTGPDGPKAELHLWPHRSLPRKGFVIFFAITFGLAAIPLLAVVGSAILWGLLPFIALVLGGAWWGLERSYRDSAVLEELRIWDARITLTRHNPRGPTQHWEANPHWVRIHDHGARGPVEHYLTLQGGPREVEIGAFLSVEERIDLARELTEALAAVR